MSRPSGLILIAQVKRLPAFCGLEWNAQTPDFVTQSSACGGDAGYYGVFRNAAAAAGKWRHTMAQADQDTVRAVVAESTLSRFWPDLDQSKQVTSAGKPARVVS